jgi:hypothetical protein
MDVIIYKWGGYVNVQAPSADTADDRDETGPALSTLANPRRVRWATLHQASGDSR